MKKIFCLALSFLLCLIPFTAFGETNGIDEELIKAKSVILMDMDTRQVLYKENEYLQLSPASVTKIMSILLIVEAIDDGKISLKDEVKASKDAVSMGGSQIWLEEGEIMSVDELLKAVIVASANDACSTLGEYVGGSKLGFVKMMNDRAKELGLENTNFENCTGLDDTTKNHYSCAYDLAIISCEVMKHDIVLDYTTIWLDSLRDGTTELNNTNKLVNTYDGITGLKTGTTSNAGFCVTATASRDSMNLVAVVLGSDTSQDRFDTASYLLDYGFANFKIVTPEIDESKITNIKVLNGKSNELKPVIKELKNIHLPKDNDDLEYNYVIEEKLKAPIEKGDIVGKIEILSNNEVIDTIELISNDDIETSSFWYVFWELIRNI